MADAVPGRVGIRFCQPCLRKDTRNVADIYCEDCGEYQCKKCEKIHQLFPVMSKHNLVNANAARKVTPKYDMKGLDQCREHHKLLEFFCDDENVLCCGKCIIVRHRSCRHIVDVEEKATAIKTDFSYIQREIDKLEDRAVSAVQHFDSARNKFTEDASNIKTRIQTMQGNVNAVFENFKQTISKEIAIYQKQTFDGFDERTNVSDSCIADLKQTSAEIQALLEQGTPAQQLIMAIHLRSHVTEIKRKIESVFGDLGDVGLKFVFNSSLNLPPVNNIMLGNLSLLYDKALEMSADIVVNSLQTQKANIKLRNSINLKQGDDDVGEPFYTGIEFLSDGRLVAVDNMNNKCLLFNLRLENLNGLKLSYKPQDLAVVSEEEVAITTSSEHKIIFIQISKANEIKLVRECKVAKSFQSVSLLNDDTLLVGSNEDIQPVLAVSVTGEERALGILFHSRTYPYITCDVAYIRNRKLVVFSDRLEHSIYIYDITSGRGVKVKDERIVRKPRVLTIGPSDSIFVCSADTHSIVQISHTGHILATHGLAMRFPRCVSASKNYKLLAVSNSDDGCRKLQLYSVVQS